MNLDKEFRTHIYFALLVPFLVLILVAIYCYIQVPEPEFNPIINHSEIKK